MRAADAMTSGRLCALAFLPFSARFPVIIALVLLTHAPPRSHALPATTLNDGLALTVWETDEELPNNDVHCLHQDRRGYLWAGTAGGLVRFDGRTFRRPQGTNDAFFQASTTYSLAETLPGELVFVHDHDAENRLLHVGPQGVKPHPADVLLTGDMRAAAVFHEDGGILWILLQDRTWLRWNHDAPLERFPPERPLSTYNQAAILPLEDGRVLLSRGGGLEIYENGQLTRMPEFGQQVVTLHTDRKGGAWIVGLQSLHHWSAEDGFTPHSPPAEMLDFWPPQLMLNGRSGETWYSFREYGLWLHDAEGARRVRTSHAIIRCITEDREGNLWVGTAGGGLNRIRKPEFALWADDRPDTIGSICQDNNGILWLGNSRGIWQLRDGTTHAPEPAEGWPNFAHSLCPSPDGALWIGGANRIFRYHPQEHPAPVEMPPGPIRHAFALFLSKDGGIWAGCETGPLIRYAPDGSPTLFGPQQGYTGDFAQTFGEDHQGRLWVGTRRGELFLKNGDHFEKIPTPLEASGTGILNITQGPGKTLWLGTRGLGFLRWKQGKFAAVTTDHGLPDGVLAQVLRVGKHFWVGSSNGIFQVAIEDLDACALGTIHTLRPLRFGRGEGLAGFFATGQRQPCAWQSTDGHLWFVGRKGVVTVDPERIDPVQAPPPVYLEEALTDRGPLPAGGTMPSGIRRYEFRFTAPNFSAPDGTRFRHRLIGFDDEWSPPTPQGLASYRSLPPGQYTFEVAASNRPKIWSFAPARFEFSVHPAWWERPAVRFTAFLTLLAAATLAARAWANRRLRLQTAALEEERKIERERSRIARDLHDGIGSGLTQIGWLAADLRELQNQPLELSSQSEALERRIRELARDLDAAVWAVSPRHDTLTSLCSYLCEFALEHFRRSPIRCRVATPERLPADTLPPQVRNHLFMATREALNNALKHSAAREVHLVLACQENSLTIGIQDDGCGFDPASALQGARNGLQNLLERMREIGGSAEISSRPGQGCLIRLHCPLAKP